MQILKALAYLHEIKKIMHRDIKPENVLVYDFKEGEHIQIKLVDFGFANHTDKSNDQVFDRLGTPNYMAPELVCE